MTLQMGVVAATFLLILVLASVMEWALSREVARIVSTVHRDGFYASRRVEVIMQGNPDVYSIRYSHRVGQGRRPPTVVRGVDALRQELEVGLS